MLLVGFCLDHKRTSVRQGDVVLGMLHFQVVCMKVAIHHNGSSKKPPKAFRSQHPYSAMLTERPYWSELLFQPSGRFIPGWGQAGQKWAKLPFSCLSALWPKPNHLWDLRSCHCLDTLRNSRSLFLKSVRRVLYAKRDHRNYGNGVRKCIVGQTTQLLHKAGSCGLALHRINVKVIQDIKGEHCFGSKMAGRKQSHLKQLHSLMRRISAPTPPDFMFENPGGMNYIDHNILCNPCWV
jgi:hypothetical protein